MTHDPTYDRERIAADPEWELAFTISELQNDDAPIGWAKYVPLARMLRHHYAIERKQPSQGSS